MTFHRWIPKLLKFKFIPAVKLQFSQGPWLQPLSLSIFKRRWGEIGLECPVDLPRRSVRTRPLSSTPESVASNLLSSIMRGDCGACAEGSEPMCCRLAAKEKVRGPRYWKMRVSETLQWQRQCSSVPLLVNWWAYSSSKQIRHFRHPILQTRKWKLQEDHKWNRDWKTLLPTVFFYYLMHGLKCK